MSQTPRQMRAMSSSPCGLLLEERIADLEIAGRFMQALGEAVPVPLRQERAPAAARVMT